jgi:hypothetical protein
MATDGDDISICSTEEMEKYEFLHQREFGHTHVYDVNLLERVGMDKELPSSSRLVVGENSTEGIGWLERWMDGWLCNRANGNASIHQLTD